MKNLNITISNEEMEKFGIYKTNLSFSELMSIIINELIGEANAMVVSRCKSMAKPKRTFGT